jgi:hypothetical protein
VVCWCCCNGAFGGAFGVLFRRGLASGTFVCGNNDTHSQKNKETGGNTTSAESLEYSDHSFWGLALALLHAPLTLTPKGQPRAGFRGLLAGGAGVDHPFKINHAGEVIGGLVADTLGGRVACDPTNPIQKDLHPAVTRPPSLVSKQQQQTFIIGF